MRALKIDLTKGEIDKIFRQNRGDWTKLLAAYDFLLKNRGRLDDVAIRPAYERTFNYFYQVRRNETWRGKFYALYSEHAQRGMTDFAEVLARLFDATGQVEMSFASKFTATIDPSLPVIDRHVLSFIDRRPPPATWPAEKRIEAIVRLHREMKESFDRFLEGERGRYLVDRFSNAYGRAVSEMKMLDMVLWQSGGKKR